ncbi:helix-turn-helix domain-containing protein [Vibrio gigantis]|uniref:winged helix-turn-helix transcriptional regulator n=1 Tax=Vibrio gigantis TaxID=296199 RepID=UPI002FC858AA
MKKNSQFCPALKTSEILFEKWTMLIVREFFLGSTRFGEFQRNLSRMSPTILTKRLKSLEQNGIIFRKNNFGQRGYEYYLTPAGKALEPAINLLEDWGMRWAAGLMTEKEQDVELFMRNIQRSIRTEEMLDGESVILFTFTDIPKYNKWWIWVTGPNIDLCTEDPGKEIDLYISTDLNTMAQAVDQTVAIKTLLRNETIKTYGCTQLRNSLPKWIGIDTVERSTALLTRSLNHQF